MKCHEYTLLVSADAMSSIHDMRSPQKRLYIPNKGVMGYNFYKKDKIDCFLDDKKSIEEGKEAIARTLEDSKYLGEIEIPDDQIDEFITSFNAKKQAEEDFQKKGKTLISLLK